MKKYFELRLSRNTSRNNNSLATASSVISHSRVHVEARRQGACGGQKKRLPELLCVVLCATVHSHKHTRGTS